LKVRLNDATAKEAATAVKLSDSVSEEVQLKRMLHQLRDQLSTVGSCFPLLSRVSLPLFLFVQTHARGRRSL